MIAVFTAPDALVIAALITSLSTSAATWWNAHKAAKATRPNGGASMRDVVDRIENKLDTEVVPRLDRGATVMAEHADRLAALEARQPRDPAARTRSTDGSAREPLQD